MQTPLEVYGELQEDGYDVVSVFFGAVGFRVCLRSGFRVEVGKVEGLGLSGSSAKAFKQLDSQASPCSQPLLARHAWACPASVLNFGS